MKQHRGSVLACLALLLAGCSWEPVQSERAGAIAVPTNLPSAQPEPTFQTPGRRRGDDAAAMAERMIGTPYRWGGADLEGFDCSGLVQFSYAQARLNVPRTTHEQRRMSRPVGRKSLRRGDLLFFDIEGKASHVGLYLGNDRFVHAPSRGKRVQTALLTQSYYARRFSGARRPPGADTSSD